MLRLSIVLLLYALPASSQTRCGLLNNTTVRIPANWATFVAPEVGQSYADPAFGCTVTRITNGAVDEALWDGSHPSMMNFYSTFTALNADDTLVMVTSNDGGWRIRRMDGGVAVAASAMPGQNNGHPVWDAVDPTAYYYAVGNVLYRGTILNGVVTSVAIKAFTEYSGIVSPDSGDMSQDGTSIALVGKNANSTMDIFVWKITTLSKTSTYRTVCTISGNIAQSGQPGCIHKLQLTANNLLTIEFASDGTGNEQGMRLWNGTSLVKLQNSTSHYDTGYDLSGNSVFIERGNANSLPGLVNPCPSSWGLDARRIASLSTAVCLLDNIPAWHVSYRGSVAQPYAAISFFDDRATGPERFNNNPNYRAPSTINWGLYEDEVVLAKVDGTEVYRLAHARSRSVESFWAQPHAAISRSGKFAVFTSNMAWPDGCPTGMHVTTECSDVYVISLLPVVVPPPPPPPPPPPNPPTMFNCTFTVPNDGVPVTATCTAAQ